MALTIFAFLGYSGSGKSEIIKEMTRRMPDKVAVFKSITTRPHRDDQDPLNYRVVTDDDFLAYEANGRLIQKTGIYGQGLIYGTCRDESEELEARNAHGMMALFEVAVPDFQRAGFRVVTIRIQPMGSYAPRSPERAKTDRERELRAPARPDFAVQNYFAPGTTPANFTSSPGYIEACAKVEGIIRGVDYALNLPK